MICPECIQRDDLIRKLKQTIDRQKSAIQQTPINEMKNVRAEVQELRKEFAGMMKILQRLDAKK